MRIWSRCVAGWALCGVTKAHRKKKNRENAEHCYHTPTAAMPSPAAPQSYCLSREGIRRVSQIPPGTLAPDCGNHCVLENVPEAPGGRLFPSKFFTDRPSAWVRKNDETACTSCPFPVLAFSHACPSRTHPSCCCFPSPLRL